MGKDEDDLSNKSEEEDSVSTHEEKENPININEKNEETKENVDNLRKVIKIESSETLSVQSH